MAFGDDVLKGFFGNDFVRDYSHASKTFRSNNSALSPRRKFLFHVVFNLNTQQIPQLSSIFQAGDLANLNLLVKILFVLFGCFNSVFFIVSSRMF